MGIGIATIDYLSRRGHIPRPHSRILDIGSQNLLGVTPEQVIEFVRRHGDPNGLADIAARAERIAYFSTPRPGERTTYLSELFDLTPNIFYTSYDVCPALKTEIFDLNSEQLPRRYRKSFDLVINGGTTEHVINQMNAFAVIHEALKVGGVAFHEVPSVGWIEHGYFTYHPTFFRDLAAANAYEIVDCWYKPERKMQIDTSQIDLRSAETPGEKNSFDPSAVRTETQCFNLNVVLRKRVDVPFRVGLELATSHSQVSASVARRYAP